MPAFAGKEGQPSPREGGDFAPEARGRSAAGALLLLLFTLPALAAPTLTVGSKRFPESEILGEVLTQLANKTGEAQATHKQGLGNTGIVFAALKAGSIDVYPEYVGTISQELLKDKGQVSLAEMNQQLAPLGLAVGVPLGFNDGYGLAMREDEAQKLGIKTLSDLAKHPDLKLGLSAEFLKRADGWEGLKAAYGLPFGTPEGFDHGAAYQALSGGQTDVADVYTTDAEIQKFHLRVLDDDRHYFPSYDAVLLYRADVPKRLPRTWAAIQTLQGKISAPLMIAMNAEANIGHRSAPDIAADFLTGKVRAGEGPTRSGQAVSGRCCSRRTSGRRPCSTCSLVFLSLALGILVGVPLGIWAARSPRGGAADFEHRRRHPDHPLARPAGLSHSRRPPDRLRAGDHRPVSVLAAAHRPQHLHRPDGHLPRPARVGVGAGPAGGRAAAADRTAAGRPRHPGRHQDLGGHQRRHGHHRGVHRRGRLRQPHQRGAGDV